MKRRRCGGLEVSVPPCLVSSSNLGPGGLPTVWSEGRRITLEYCTNTAIQNLGLGVGCQMKKKIHVETFSNRKCFSYLKNIFLDKKVIKDFYHTFLVFT